MKIVRDSLLEGAILKAVSKYKLFKIVVLINESCEEKYKDIIERLNQEVKDVAVVKFPDNLKEENLVSGLILNSLTEDVGCIVNFCDSFILRIAINCCDNLKIFTVLTEPDINVFLLKPNSLIIADNVILSCNKKTIANSYGKLCSLMFYLVEQVFNCVVLEQKENNKNLLRLDELMQKLTLIPSAVLKSNLGKMKLVDFCVEISGVLSYEKFDNCYVKTLSKTIAKVCSCNSLLEGELLMLSSVIFLKEIDVLLTANNLMYVGYNSYCRIKNYKQIFASAKLGDIYNSFCADGDVDLYISNFFNIKNELLMVFNQYKMQFEKMLNCFNLMYFDRGYKLGKSISKQNLLLSVNLVPENYKVASYATFIRAVGLLNKL